MTISVGSFEDLQPDSAQPIDRNPTLQCQGQCGRSFNWQDYWKERYLLSDDPRTAPQHCDECLESLDIWHDRLVKNHSLSAFTSEGDA